MAQLLVRNLDDAVKQLLQRRAARRGRSMEEEAREILRPAAYQDEAEAKAAKLGTRIAHRFAVLASSRTCPNSTDWRPRPIWVQHYFARHECAIRAHARPAGPCSRRWTGRVPTTFGPRRLPRSRFDSDWRAWPRGASV